MALKIERKADSRVIKAILHRVADIPGGVTVSTGDLGGAALLEGTPMGLHTDGMFHVTKTALIVTDAANNATSYEVAKGHHFKVGDIIATEGANGQTITAIDKTTHADKDVITVGTTLGVAITAASKTVIFHAAATGGKVVKYPPTAIAGSTYDVVASDNLFCDAWLMAVLRTGNAPAVNATLTGTMKGIIYIV